RRESPGAPPPPPPTERGATLMQHVVAYVPDLMDRSRITAVAAGCTFVRSAEELVQASSQAGPVVVDLNRPGGLAALARVTSRAPRTLAFASHVDRDVLDEARAAGCDQVLARSAFFSRLPDLLG